MSLLTEQQFNISRIKQKVFNETYAFNVTISNFRRSLFAPQEVGNNVVVNNNTLIIKEVEND